MSRLHLCTALCLLASLTVLCSTPDAKTFVQNTEQPFSFRNSIQQGRFEQSMKMAQFSQSPFLAQETPTAAGEDNVDIYGFKGKSLKRAFLYSLLVPGTGEFYAGSKIKAVAFFGLDVALWALYFNYRGKGTDKESEYRKYADANWSEEEYRSWLREKYKIESDTQPYYEDPLTHEKFYFSHHLPSSKTGQYYEMIGKYLQFRWGWYGWDAGYEAGFDEKGDECPLPLDWNSYRDMRELSNRLLNKATYSAMFSLANHILSAFDAAISVRGYNKKGEKFGQIDVKTRLVERQQEVIPRLTISLKF
jgi:hypothetical protein